MAPVDLRARVDDLHQPLRDNLLLARRSARIPRHGRNDHGRHGRDLRVCRPDRKGTIPSLRSAFLVLAFCRCGLGRRFYGRVRAGTLREEKMATLLITEEVSESLGTPREIDVPAPTAWPLVLAFGCTLLFAGLVTSISVSFLGAVLSLAGSIGWFRAGSTREHEEAVPVISQDIRITTERHVVERVSVADYQPAWLPVHTYPVSAGVKGGLAGSVAMAVLACAYGVLKAGSIWYPINLLAAVVYAPSEVPSASQLNSFHAGIFFIAVVLHLVTSILVGLLYGAMLPMFARRPIVLGGLIAPVLWSGLLYSIMELLNPLLASHINWFWFMASQIAFGVVAGFVVVRQERVSTRENLPFFVRAGVEAPGIVPRRESGEKRP